MHLHPAASQRAYPHLMTELSPPKQFNGYHWLLLIMLLLHVGTTTAISEEGLPSLGSTPLSTTSSPLSSEQQVAALLKQSATVLTAAQPRRQAGALATHKAYSLVNQRSERWLSQFGRARVNLGSDSRFKRFEGEIALLLPLDESCSRPLTFSQLGVHHYHGQPVANIGVGQRHLMQEWLWGYNAFLDQNLRHAHSRLGVGAELWRDYLKLSGNGYFALSHWKNSKKIDGYQEKVASGFDLRAQGYWPTHPQLGAHLLFENYFGDQVALFDKRQDDWQKNPLAATVGVQYTPVPLFTVGVDHKIGRQSRKETRFTLQFDYLLDLPWEYQIAPCKVAVQRALPISKYDWVQRNNRLVLQYRQLAPISLTLPSSAQLVGFPEETIPLEATVEARFGFKEIHWNSEALTTAGGRIEQATGRQGEGIRYQVILPKNPGRYPITGIAVDQQGNQSSAATTEVTVKNPVNLTLPPKLSGNSEAKLTLEAAVEAHFGFKEINWDSEKLTAAGGSIQQLEGLSYEVILPREEGRYPLTGIAIDQHGYQSALATTELVVSNVLVVVEKTLYGKPGETIDFITTVEALNGLAEIHWQGEEFVKDGGMISEKSTKNQIWTLVFPLYEKTYPVTFIAYDLEGNESPPALMQIIVKKEVPELKIQGPTANELPTTWLYGEKLQLTAAGGDGQYQWSSSNSEVVVYDKGNGQCEVTIEGSGGATIEVTSAGATASYRELETKQPTLFTFPSTTFPYLKSEYFCQEMKGSLPTKQILDDILQARKTVFLEWAEVWLGTKEPTLVVWVKDESGAKAEQRPGYELRTGAFYTQLNGDTDQFVLCQLNP
jgi:Inverse autotransporter, beta-domain